MDSKPSKMNATSAPTPVSHRVNKAENIPTAANGAADSSTRLPPTSMPHASSGVGVSGVEELFGDAASQRVAVFPSPPPSTSTGGQTSERTANRRRPPANFNANAASHATAQPSGRNSNNFFSFLFRGRTSENRSIQNYISSEGSITINAWQMMNKQANPKMRLKILESLTSIAQQRRLQVSTLEGIWVETQDMLEDPMLKVPFLNLFYNVTISQIEELGLALRLTFFETIKHIGLSELTANWLTALTAHGKNLEPFEMTCAELVSEWLEKVVLDEAPPGQPKFVHPLAPEVIRLSASLIRHQTAFVDEESLSRIIRCCCKRIVRGPGEQLGACLSLLEAIFDHCVVASADLFVLVSSLCFLVCVESEAEKTWKLLSVLLTSEHSYAVFQLLQQLMRSMVPNADDERHDVAVQIARGAVYVLSMTLWGSKKIETVQCAPSVVLPAFEEAMISDPLVARQVMHAVRRLVVKQGKLLSLFTWVRVNKLLRAAVVLCGEDVETAAVIRKDLHGILSIVESLVDRGEFKGSPDEFFALIEDCVIDRPDSSAMRLIDYRIACLTPEKEKWIEQIHSLLTKFLYDGVSLVRREKAVYVMENILKTHRVLHERALLTKIVFPICSTLDKERVPSIQYFLLHVLFEVAKTTTINPNGTNELFMSVLGVIGTAFNGGINLGNDNLEVAACGINELLDERWTVFDLPMVQTIFTIVIKHLELQYLKLSALTSGADVRMRLFESLLLLASHPLNGQMARVIIRSPTQFEPVYNARIVRAGENADGEGEFRWTAICEACTLGLESEKNWPAYERILEFLSGSLEHRVLVRTAGSEAVGRLVNAVLSIVGKAEQRFPYVPRAKLARYLCPVLGKLVNYTQESQICRIVVQLIRTGCPQAIMACNAAIQVLPDKMALFNRSLLECLVSLKPCAQLALPIIELLNDCADVGDFYHFFQNKQFKSVINVLAPYSNARQYNAFVVNSVYQTAMRWYLCVPLADRAVIAAHMFGSFASANGLLPAPTNRSTESPEPSDFALSLVSTGERVNSFGQLVAEDADQHPTALIITPAKKRCYGHKKSTTASTTAPHRELHANTSTDSPPAHERHASGDGRQPTAEYPFDEPLPLFSTGDTVSIGLETTDNEFNVTGINDLAQQILAQEYAAQQEAKQTHPSRESLAATLTMESLQNLNDFVRFFRSRLVDNAAPSSGAAFSAIFDENPVPMSPTADQMLDELVEQKVDTWVVEGSVITMRVLVKRETAPFGLHSRRVATISVDRPSTANSMASDAGTKASRAAAAIAAANNAGNPRLNRSMSRGKQSTPPASSNARRQPRISTTSTDSDEHRRRHKSAREVISTSPKKSLQTSVDASGLQSPPLQSGRATPNTPDGSDEIFDGQSATRGDLLDEWSPSKNTECIQLVIRHVFGRESYVLRSMDQISPEFGGSSAVRPSDPATLLMHLRGNRSAVHLATRDADLIRRSLNFLDRMPTIEEHNVGVLYVRDARLSLADVLATEYGSDRFVHFVRRLGAQTAGGKDGVFTFVHADLQTRLCFQIATLMPNSLEDPACERKRRILEAAPVCVIFNESGSPLFATENPLNELIRQAEQVAFEVLPQDDSTVLVNVHSRREVACWLAMSRALLPDDQANRLLQKLAIRAKRALNVWSSLANESEGAAPFVSCTVERQRHIKKLRKRGKPEAF